MIERFEESEGLGAIFPPMIFSIVALRCLGLSPTTAPKSNYCHKHLDGLVIEDEHSLRLQPCKSPIWDTAITLRALAASGSRGHDHEAVERGVGWLLGREDPAPRRLVRNRRRRAGRLVLRTRQRVLSRRRRHGRWC